MSEVRLPVDAPETADAVSPLRLSLQRFGQHRLAVAGLVVFVLIAFSCFALPPLFPFTPEDADFSNIAAPVDLFSLHPFGTDDLGRDLLVRVLAGGQISLTIGIFGAVVSVAFSLIYGATAGYLGGWVDVVMMRTVDILLSVPFMFMVILVNVVLGGTTVSFFVAIVIGLWLTPAIVTRGVAVSLRGREFVEAARAGGMSGLAIIRVHIIPNSLNVAIVYSGLLVLEAVPTESFLSFLGLGVQPPNASWGTLIAEGAQALDTDARLLLLPGTLLALTLLSLNFISDGIRDAFDPNG